MTNTSLLAILILARKIMLELSISLGSQTSILLFPEWMNKYMLLVPMRVLGGRGTPLLSKNEYGGDHACSDW